MLRRVKTCVAKQSNPKGSCLDREKSETWASLRERAVEGLLGLSSFRVRIFEAIEATAVVNCFQTFSKPQLIQVVTQEHSLRAAFAGSCATARGPAKQHAGNGLHIGMDISTPSTKHVPDGHQQLTGDGNNGLGFANAYAESLKFP